MSAGIGLARQLAAWCSDGLAATLYLVTGGYATSDRFEFDESEGLLSYEAPGGVLHFINPDHVTGIHWGPPEDRDPACVPVAV